MKKIIILLLLFTLMSSLILLNNGVKADEIDAITPYYSGDILNGKDLYLFQDFETNPNFENGFLSKKTISSTDIYYSETVATSYNSWYKDLGMDLIDEIAAPDYSPSNPYFTMYVTFNNMLGIYFQLGVRITGPFLTEFYLKFKDEPVVSLLDVDESGGYLLLTEQNQTNKQIEWLSWKVYYPDYLPSFKPLTADLAYQFGIDSGYQFGYDDGYRVGERIGKEIGYQNGLADAAEKGYYAVFNFNQLIKNGNFTSGEDWQVLGATANFNNNTCYLLSNTLNGRLRQVFTDKLNVDHVYYLSGDISQHLITAFRTSDGTRILNIFYNQFPYYFKSNYDYAELWIYDNRASDWTEETASNVYLIDLTLMFGEGHEPNENDAKALFSSKYYEYTEGKEISLNYIDGYNVGLSEGYVKGSNAQASKQLTATGWIKNIFVGIGSLLNLQIFPGVTIGLIVGIPFIITLAYFVIRAFRGGGGA